MPLTTNQKLHFSWHWQCNSILAYNVSYSSRKIPRESRTGWNIRLKNTSPHSRGTMNHPDEKNTSDGIKNTIVYSEISKNKAKTTVYLSEVFVSLFLTNCPSRLEPFFAQSYSNYYLQQLRRWFLGIWMTDVIPTTTFNPLNFPNNYYFVPP